MKRLFQFVLNNFGGLPTPRAPAEIKYINGKRHVITKDNVDITANFKKGAKEVLKLAKSLGIKKAILQSRSPSCGCGKVYNGNFDNKLIDGNGILAQLLLDNGIEVISSDEYIEFGGYEK